MCMPQEHVARLAVVYIPPTVRALFVNYGSTRQLLRLQLFDFYSLISLFYELLYNNNNLKLLRYSRIRITRS